MVLWSWAGATPDSPFPPAPRSADGDGKHAKGLPCLEADCAEEPFGVQKYWHSKLTKLDPRSTGNYPTCTLAHLPAATRRRCLTCPAHPASHRFDPLLAGRRHRRAWPTTATDKAAMTAVETQTAARSAAVDSARLSQTSIFPLGC